MLVCKYKGEVGVYILAMHVDNDMAMALGREMFGYPKKMAEIKFKPGRVGASGWGVRMGSGAYPRARRSTCNLPATRRTTESSTARRMGRLCTRKASATGPNRLKASSLSMQRGSFARLPLVTTRGRGKSLHSR